MHFSMHISNNRFIGNSISEYYFTQCSCFRLCMCVVYFCNRQAVCMTDVVRTYFYYYFKFCVLLFEETKPGECASNVVLCEQDLFWWFLWIFIEIFVWHKGWAFLIKILRYVYSILTWCIPDFENGTIKICLSKSVDNRLTPVYITEEFCLSVLWINTQNINEILSSFCCYLIEKLNQQQLQRIRKCDTI